MHLERSIFKQQSNIKYTLNGSFDVLTNRIQATTTKSKYYKV